MSQFTIADWHALMTGTLSGARRDALGLQDMSGIQARQYTPTRLYGFDYLDRRIHVLVASAPAWVQAHVAQEIVRRAGDDAVKAPAFDQDYYAGRMLTDTDWQALLDNAMTPTRCNALRIPYEPVDLVRTTRADGYTQTNYGFDYAYRQCVLRFLDARNAPVWVHEAVHAELARRALATF